MGPGLPPARDGAFSLFEPKALRGAFLPKEMFQFTLLSLSFYFSLVPVGPGLPMARDRAFSLLEPKALRGAFLLRDKCY